MEEYLKLPLLIEKRGCDQVCGSGAGEESRNTAPIRCMRVDLADRLLIKNAISDRYATSIAIANNENILIINSSLINTPL